MATVTYSAPYLGNKNTKEVHKVSEQKSQCQLGEIIAARNAVPYQTLADAKAAGYDNCQYCLGKSTR